MRYQKIESQIWNDEKFIQLSPMQQRLWFYILTSPHVNLTGVYVLKAGYVCDDLKCLPKDFAKDLEKIIELGLVEYDYSVSVIVVKNFLKHNPITNPNQIKAAVKQIKSLPKTPLIPRFLSAWQSTFERFDEGLIEALTKGLLKPETETEAETEAEAETEEGRFSTSILRRTSGNGKETPAKKAHLRLSDDEWLTAIRNNPAYKGIDIEIEQAKMQAWCLTKGVKPTRGRLLNWLNKAEKVLSPSPMGGVSRNAMAVMGMINRLRGENA